MYEASEIPAGSFGGSPDRPEDEIKTISFSHHIVARKGVSESTIAAFTRQLFAIRQSLKNEFPLAAKIETPDTDKDATIPVHPGAAAFVDGEEKTLSRPLQRLHLVELDGACPRWARPARGSPAI